MQVNERQRGQHAPGQSKTGPLHVEKSSLDLGPLPFSSYYSNSLHPHFVRESLVQATITPVPGHSIGTTYEIRSNASAALALCSLFRVQVVHVAAGAPAH